MKFTISCQGERPDVLPSVISQPPSLRGTDMLCEDVCQWVIFIRPAMLQWLGPYLSYVMMPGIILCPKYLKVRKLEIPKLDKEATNSCLEPTIEG